MNACKKATNFVLADPEAAFRQLTNQLPKLNTKLAKQQFQRSFGYFSATLQNVHRDWAKVSFKGTA
jgi:pyrimidine precursor biosynthesis enzyme